MEESPLWSTEGTTDAERRTWDLADEIAARIITLMGGMSVYELADLTGKHKSVIDCILGGGVDVTIGTIAELESALGGHIIEVVR